MPNQKNRGFKIVILYILVIFPFLLDRVIKSFFIKNPSFKQDFLFLRFSLTTNTGIAFGISFNQYLLYTIIFFFIAALIITMFKLKNNYARLILFLIILAAISNFTDRLLYGAVVDYIELPALIALNIADIMISLGFIIISILYIFKKEDIFQ